jgi:glycosyltransferase involved in cell wall biosynthesis
VTRPLRVLHLANQAGMLRLFILPVARAMRQAGAEVELACMEMGPNFAPLAESGFALHSLSPCSWSRPGQLLRLWRELRRLFKRGRYDLLVVHTPVMSWLARPAASRYVRAVVYMAHGLPFAPQQAPRRRRLFRHVEQLAGRFTDGIMVMNAIDEQACRRWRLTRSGGFCFKVPGVGIDAGAWAAPLDEAQRAQLDEQLGLRPDKPLLLYLGRLVPDKRPADMLTLARRLGPDAADFVLAGEGPLWAQTRQQAAEVGPHVKVIGFTDLAPQLVQRCDVGLFPSVYIEGLPRFLLELAAAGKPAVAYDVRGSRDAIDDGRTGLLVAPGDVEAFVSAVRRVLADGELKRSMSQAGPAWVGERFSLERSIQCQLSALAEVLAARGLEAPWSERANG